MDQDDTRLSLKAAMEAERRQHQQDFYNELHGTPAGRMRRFFFANSFLPYFRMQQNRAVDLIQNVLLETDLIRRQQRIQQFQTDMTLADTASYEVLLATRELFDAAMVRLSDIQSRAETLPDGRRVYLSRDGSYAIDEDLERLSDADIASVEWDGAAPTAEDYADAKRDLDDLGAEIEAIEDYRERLETIESTVAEHGVPEGAAFEEMEDDLYAMPDTVRARFEAMGGKANPSTGVSAEKDVTAPTSNVAYTP
ncbi:MAG: hypothetical protein AAGD92_03225 [Pseudomonadota bacterium]